MKENNKALLFTDVVVASWSTVSSAFKIGPTEGNPRQAIQLNDTYVIEGNIDNNGKFDRIKLALALFDF